MASVSVAVKVTLINCSAKVRLKSILKMNSSVVLNVLYGYFDVKKDKLKWTGSLEDLKAFVLTVIDEETAETTTW